MIKQIINDVNMMIYYRDYKNICDIIKQIIIWIIEGINNKGNKKND